MTLPDAFASRHVIPRAESSTDPTTEGKPPTVGNAAHSAAVTQTPGNRQRRPKAGGFPEGSRDFFANFRMTGTMRLAWPPPFPRSPSHRCPRPTASWRSRR